MKIAIAAICLLAATASAAPVQDMPGARWLQNEGWPVWRWAILDGDVYRVTSEPYATRAQVDSLLSEIRAPKAPIAGTVQRPPLAPAGWELCRCPQCVICGYFVPSDSCRRCGFINSQANTSRFRAWRDSVEKR